MKQVNPRTILQPSENKTRKANFHASTHYEIPKSYSDSKSINEYSSYLPMIFQSPYIDTDLQIFEGIWANTIVGRAIDVRAEYAIGRGARPSFVLNDRKIKDPNEKQDKISSYDDIIMELEKIDRRRGVKLNDKLPGLLTDMHVFGRAVLGFEPGNDENGKPRDIIALKPIHPRDLGRVFARDIDWTVSSCYAYNKKDLLKSEEMIYLAQLRKNPIRRSLNYGFSSVQRLMGQARSLRRINEFDIPEVAEAMWAKYGMLRVDQDGMTDIEKQQDLQTIRDGLKPGAFNIVTGKKDEIEFTPMDNEPKVKELGDLKDTVDRDALGNFQIPGGMFGREADQTRATMIGKIKLFVAGPVQQDRRLIGQVLIEQYYENNLRLIGREDILEEVSFEVTFEPIIIESWMDNVEAVSQLHALIPSIPYDELLRLLDLEDLIPKLEKLKTGNEASMMSEANLKQIKDVTQDTETKNKVGQLLDNFTNLKATIDYVAKGYDEKYNHLLQMFQASMNKPSGNTAITSVSEKIVNMQAKALESKSSMYDTLKKKIDEINLNY